VKQSDAWRAALLATAVDEFADFEKEAQKPKGRHADHRGFEILVGDLEDCIQPDAYITVDDETGRLIAAAAKQIIIDRLKALGVTMEEEK